VTVMRNGSSVATLDIAATHRDQILHYMVGEERATPAPVIRANVGQECLMRVRSLASERLRDVSFELRKGEVLGLGGLHGQGQSALLRSIFGAEHLRAGSIEVRGRELVARRPADAMRSGIAYVSGDRTRAGALANRPIFENLVLATLAIQRSPLVNRNEFVGRVKPLLDRLKVKFPGFDAAINELSGGNQQKVLIGRWLATAPSVLLLDDPTKGIDVAAKRDLFDLIRELAAEGLGILLFSSEDEELLGNADRVLVFNAGRISGELVGDSLNAHALNRAAFRMDLAS
jgi:ribose transport system ATP-binding protein